MKKKLRVQCLRNLTRFGKRNCVKMGILFYYMSVRGSFYDGKLPKGIKITRKLSTIEESCRDMTIAQSLNIILIETQNLWNCKKFTRILVCKFPIRTHEFTNLV